MIKNKNIYIYDSTLRDGAQTKGVDFSLSDKIAIAKMLDDLGIDYIEGGWPGANPTDTEFFQKKINFKNSRLTAFGMTKRNREDLPSYPKILDFLILKTYQWLPSPFFFVHLYLYAMISPFEFEQPISKRVK